MVRDRNIAYQQVDISVKVPQRGKLYELDLMNGGISAVDSKYIDGAYRFATSLDVLETRFYIVSERDIADAVPAEKLRLGAGEKLQNLPMSYTLSEPNKLVLDHAAWRIDNGVWNKENYILLVDDDLRAALNSAPRGGLMAQPWRWDKTRKWQTAELELLYTFNCETLPEADCTLYLEHPELYRFELNGQHLEAQADGFWMEDVLKGIKIPASMFRSGKNELKLYSTYHCGQRGLEAMYISGFFGIKGRDTITALPEKLYFGDWCEQLLPYYAGNITCHTEVETAMDAVLKFGEWRGSLLGVTLDGGEETLLPWPPYQVRIPAGRHRVSITLYGHRRNALGPFYLNEKWPVRTGPYQHKVYEHPERQLVPFGILENPELCPIKK